MSFEENSPKVFLTRRATQNRYFLTHKGSREREVSLAEFLLAETAAGFTSISPGVPATGGFGTPLVIGRVALF